MDINPKATPTKSTSNAWARTIIQWVDRAVTKNIKQNKKKNLCLLINLKWRKPSFLISSHKPSARLGEFFQPSLVVLLLFFFKTWTEQNSTKKATLSIRACLPGWRTPKWRSEKSVTGKAAAAAARIATATTATATAKSMLAGTIAGLTPCLSAMRATTTPRQPPKDLSMTKEEKKSSST